ncbi:hypothetical protein Esti_005442 [Eimeria stiedai]
MLPQSVDLKGREEEVEEHMHRLLLFSLARESAFAVLQRKRKCVKMQTQQLQRLRELELNQLRQEEEQQRQLQTLREKHAFLSAALNRVLQDLRLCEMLDRFREAPQTRGGGVFSADWSKEKDREKPSGSHAKARKLPELESALLQQKQARAVLLESAASLRACCEEALVLQEAIGRVKGDTGGDHWTSEAQGLSLPSDCLLGADAELLAAEERLFALEAEVDASLRELPALEGLQQHLFQKAISSIPERPSAELRGRSLSFRTFNSASGELAGKHEGLLHAANSPHRPTDEEPASAIPGRFVGGRNSSGVVLLPSDSAATQREGEAVAAASSLEKSIPSSLLSTSHEKRCTHSPNPAVYMQLADESVKRAQAAEGFEHQRNQRCSPSQKESDEERWSLSGKTAARLELQGEQQHLPSPSALDQPRIRKNEECLSNGIYHASEVEGVPQEWLDFSSQHQFQHLTGCEGSVETAEKTALEVSSSREVAELQRGISTPVAKAAMAVHAAGRIQEQLGLDVHSGECDYLQLHVAASDEAAAAAVRRQHIAELQAEPRREVQTNLSKDRECDRGKPAFCGSRVASNDMEEEENREAEPESAAVLQPPLITSTPTAAAQLHSVAAQTNTEAALLGPKRQGDLPPAAAAAAFPRQSGLRLSDLHVGSLLDDGPAPQGADHSLLRHYEKRNFH